MKRKFIHDDQHNIYIFSHFKIFLIIFNIFYINRGFLVNLKRNNKYNIFYHNINLNNVSIVRKFCFFIHQMFLCLNFFGPKSKLYLFGRYL